MCYCISANFEIVLREKAASSLPVDRRSLRLLDQRLTRIYAPAFCIIKYSIRVWVDYCFNSSSYVVWDYMHWHDVPNLCEGGVECDYAVTFS